ncbi:signal peptidase I, partial [Gordonibacter pamelaeae]
MDSGQHAEPRRSGAFRTILSLLVMVAFVFGLSWALRTFVFQPYEIPSGSMENTIMTGDMVFSEKISYYLRDPEPGDIVTFQDPEIPGRVLIKRCIAVGGQTVDLVDGRV